MNKTTKIILLLIIISILLIGCSTQQTPTSKTKKNNIVNKQTRDGTPEEVLVREIADGKLVEVYDEYVRLGKGETRDNWMIINNVKDEKEEFRIYPCDGCEFETEKVEIAPGKYSIIQFEVSAEDGQKEIKVKDKLNNAYGYASISVLVE